MFHLPWIFGEFDGPKFHHQPRYIFQGVRVLPSHCNGNVAPPPYTPPPNPMRPQSNPPPPPPPVPSVPSRKAPAPQPKPSIGTFFYEPSPLFLTHALVIEFFTGFCPLAWFFKFLCAIFYRVSYIMAFSLFVLSLHTHSLLVCFFSLLSVVEVWTSLNKSVCPMCSFGGSSKTCSFLWVCNQIALCSPHKVAY